MKKLKKGEKEIRTRIKKRYSEKLRERERKRPDEGGRGRGRVKRGK